MNRLVLLLRLFAPLTKLGLALCLLTITWLIFFYWLLALTEGALAPWDLIPREAVDQRPPVGSASQIVNNFFESPPGSWLPAQLLLGCSVLAFAWRLYQRAPLVNTALRFAASILIFVVVNLWLGLVALLLYEQFLPADLLQATGFHQSLPLLLVTALLLVGLLRVQWLGKPYRALLSFGRKA